MSALPGPVDLTALDATAAPQKRNRYLAAWRSFSRSRYGMLGLCVLVVMCALAILAPLLTSYGPFELGDKPFARPLSPGHPLGTDHLGRDVWSQILYGARISLVVGLIAALIAAVIGVVIGSISGFFGGWLDAVLSRFTDVFLIMPAFFLIIIVVATLGNSLFYVMVVIGLTTWPGNARLMRAQVLTLRERQYIQSLTALGESRWRILARHIIPNGIQPIIANSTLLIAAAILTEAGLAFLGLGDPNKASWGRMINDGRPSILTAWWPSVFAGLAMIVTVLAFYLIGDGIAAAIASGGERDRE
ncbi:MAG TPA: ABC transporter permease [Thermomicrobiales bacterium]|jgi:peptide/nickel transport system permease protein|nr:ABC transporter permease [Thermomicrobiales bacterium]